MVAATWADVLRDAGWDVVTVAGDGPVDRLIPGLAWPVTGPPPTVEEVKAAEAPAEGEAGAAAPGAPAAEGAAKEGGKEPAKS